VPESGQKPDNEEVTNHHVFLLGVRTAERFVYILTEPRSQTDVPARHELSDGTTHKGIAEVSLLAIDPKDNVIAGLHTIALRPNKNLDSTFLYYLFKTQTFRKYGYKVGTGMKVFGISPTNLMKYEYYHPSLEEQQAIGAKISQLETLKKKLLQDMFI